MLYNSSVDLSHIRSVNEIFSILLRLSYNEQKVWIFNKKCSVLIKTRKCFSKHRLKLLTLVRVVSSENFTLFVLAVPSI